MNTWEYLALGLALWTATGLLGLSVSVARGERRKLGQGVASLAGVWVIYLGVLLFASSREPEQHIAPGRPVCFHAMCFTVTRVEEVPGYFGRNRVGDGSRLVRVTVQVANHGKSSAVEKTGAYLRDGQGRVWIETPGLSGNPLDGPVRAGGSVDSEPVFQVAPDATNLGLMLTHGRSSWHRLVIGDAESLGHRPRVMDLGR